MTTIDPIENKVKESAGIRLAVLFGTFFMLLLVSSVIGSEILSLMKGNERGAILYSSIVQSVLAFCIPSFILAKFISKDWAKWLKLTKPPKIKAIAGVVIVYLLSIPAMEWLVDWNANIHLPEAFSSMESTMREWEDAAQSTTRILLDSNGWLSVLTGVLVVGLITGFSEELFFRGGLQGILSDGNQKKWMAIWISAFIFSTIHFQFFGFVPRLLMGVFFGYLFYWTQNLWVPIFAHVLNNSMVVIIAGITGDTAGDLSQVSGFLSSVDDIYLVIGSIVSTGLFIWLGAGMFKTNVTTETWQKNQLPSATEI